MPRKPGPWKITGKGIREQFQLLYPDVTWKDVHDGAKRKPFVVRPSDVKCSQAHNPLNCAVALAFKNSPGGFLLPIVSERVTHLGNPRTGEILRYMNSTKLRNEIRRCDKSKVGEFNPGIYSLIPHPPSSSLGVSHHHNGGRTPRKVGNRKKTVIRGWNEIVREIAETNKKIPTEVATSPGASH